MAVIYSPDIKTNRMIVVRDAIDAAATPGKIQVGTVGMGVVIAEAVLNDPCGNVTGSQLAFAGFPKQVNALATGIIAEARYLDGDGNIKTSGLTAGLVDSDIIVNNVNVNAGQPVTINPTTLNHG